MILKIMNNAIAWVVLTYKVPNQPSRFRLQIWRKLHKMGAVYLQDAVCVLPDRPDLSENMHYIAASIEEMGGSCFLFQSSALLPGGSEEIVNRFRDAADARLDEIIIRLGGIQKTMDEAVTLTDLERIEGELKRERVDYLRTRKLAYFGSTKEAAVDSLLESLKNRLDNIYRSEK
jgi:hypothetical protein